MNKEGICQYVDYTSSQTLKCTLSMLKQAKKLYYTVKFKPAIRNGKNVDSYIIVEYTPWIYSEQEYLELNKKHDDYLKSQNLQ